MTVNLSQVLPAPGPSQDRTYNPGNQSPSAHHRPDKDYGSDVPPTEPATPQHVPHPAPPAQVAGQSEAGNARELNGRSVLQYRDGRYRCLARVTNIGKSSQFTRKSERPPGVGQVCEMSFGRMDEVMRHLKTARWHRTSDEEEHKCDKCGKRFSRMDALRRHEKTCHTSTLFVLHLLVNRLLPPLVLPAREKHGAQA